MQTNARFVGIIAVVIVVIAGLWMIMHEDDEADVKRPESAAPTEHVQPSAMELPKPPETSPSSKTSERAAATSDAVSSMPPQEAVRSAAARRSPDPVTTCMIEGTVLVNGSAADDIRVFTVTREADYVMADATQGGKYTLAGIAAGDASVRVAVGAGVGFPVAEQTVRGMVAGKTYTANFDVEMPEGALEGKVTMDGTPVPNTNVTLAIEVEDQTIAVRYSATDAEGNYRFELLPSGNALVRVLRDSKRFEQPIFETALAENALTTLDIELGAAATVSGLVTGIPEGWKLMGALVRGSVPMPQPDRNALMRLIQHRIVIGGSMSDDGVYELEGIPPGHYTAIVYATPPTGEADGFVQGSAEITIEPGATEAVADVMLE